LASISQSISLNFISPEVKFWNQKFTKFNFGWASAPDPAGGAYDTSPVPLVSWGGGYPARRSILFPAFGI